MSAVEASLDVLARQYDLSLGAVAALRCLLAELAADARAPSGVRVAEQAVDLHVADSLVALGVPAVRSAAVIADVGSGAGFPGLPLAAALPRARVFLVESAVRKAAFIERAAQAAGLQNACVVPERAEQWAAGLGACDVVLARAVGQLAVLAEYAAPLLSLGGVLVAWKGAPQEAEEAAGTFAARELGLEPREILKVEPFAGVRHRTLYLYDKLRPTPERFPRRAGVAQKRPLGSDRSSR